METNQPQTEYKPIDLLRSPEYWREKGSKAGEKAANELINKIANEADKRCQNVIT